MIRLRPVTDKDIPFIEKVYRSRREDDLSLSNWQEFQKEAFIKMQCFAQSAEYKKAFPNSDFEIIEYKKKPVGRMYTGETETELRLIDISLLPEFRGKGIGTKLIMGLIEKASGAKKILSLHVAPNNPAYQLYLRMGFKHTGNNRHLYYMEFRP